MQHGGALAGGGVAVGQRGEAAGGVLRAVRPYARRTRRRARPASAHRSRRPVDCSGNAGPRRCPRGVWKRRKTSDRFSPPRSGTGAEVGRGPECLAALVGAVRRRQRERWPVAKTQHRSVFGGRSAQFPQGRGEPRDEPQRARTRRTACPLRPAPYGVTPLSPSAFCRGPGSSPGPSGCPLPGRGPGSSPAGGRRGRSWCSRRPRPPAGDPCRSWSGACSRRC